MALRVLFLVFFAVFGVATAVAGPAISLKRGLPTDIWLTWPDERAWSEPGFLDVYPEWRKSYGSADLKSAHAAGFDFIRLTIDPAPYISEANPERTAHMIAGVQQSIADIKAAGLQVIVDLHAIPVSGRKVGTETYLRDDSAFEAYLAFVGEMGKAIAKEDPAWVALEPMNEPTIDCEWETEPAKQRWPAMALRLHDVARKAAPGLTLVISGACWGGAGGLAKLDPATFKDDNIYWSFHSYEPFLISHQGASWVEGSAKFISGLRYPPDRSQKGKVLKDALKKIAASDLPSDRKKAAAEELRNDLNKFMEPGQAEELIAEPFKKATEWAAKHKIPASRIILGEFGVIKQDQAAETPLPIRAALLQKVRMLAEENGMAWSVWSWGGPFGVTDNDKTRKFTPVILESLGLDGPS
jgi:endoglucanase